MRSGAEKCYFCQGEEAENYIIVNEKINKVGYICKICNYESKSTCNVCSFICLRDDILMIQGKEPMCKNCFIDQSSKCSECNVYSICSCTCNKFFCQRCSVKHFLDDVRDFNHYFQGASGNYFLPDLSNIDDHIKSFMHSESIPLQPGFKSMNEFYFDLINSYQSKLVTGFLNPRYLDYYEFFIGLVYVLTGYLISGQAILQKATILIKNEDYYRFISVFCTKEFVRNELESLNCNINDQKLKYLIEKSKSPSKKKIKLGKSIDLCTFQSFHELYDNLAYFKILNIKKNLGKFVNLVHYQFQGIIILPILYKIKGKISKNLEDLNRALVLSNQVWLISSNMTYRFMFAYSKLCKSEKEKFKSIVLKVIQLSIQSSDHNYSNKAFKEINPSSQ